MNKEIAEKITEILRISEGCAPFTLTVNPVNPANHSLTFYVGRTKVEAKGVDIPEVLEKLTRE